MSDFTYPIKDARYHQDRVARNRRKIVQMQEEIEAWEEIVRYWFRRIEELSEGWPDERKVRLKRRMADLECPPEPPGNVRLEDRPIFGERVERDTEEQA